MSVPATAEPAPASATRSCRLLVVDDDPLSRSLQARLLGLLGHTAQAIDDADAAVKAALTDDIDGMLLDLSMPHVDGFTVLARLREAEGKLKRRPLPVIAVTGYAASVDRLRCLMAGFNDHLTKPIDVRDLGAALARHLPVEHPATARDSDAARVEAAAHRLAQVKPSDARFGPTLLEAFAMRSGHLIEEISRAQQLRDCNALRHATKALHASADFMGASGLATLCDRLRQAAENGDHVQTEGLVRQLSEEHQSVLVLLLRAKVPAGDAA